MSQYKLLNHLRCSSGTIRNTCLQINIEPQVNLETLLRNYAFLKRSYVITQVVGIDNIINNQVVGIERVI